MLRVKPCGGVNHRRTDARLATQDGGGGSSCVAIFERTEGFRREGEPFLPWDADAPSRTGYPNSIIRVMPTASRNAVSWLTTISAPS